VCGFSLISLRDEETADMKYTFLSKWTVLILTMVTAGLTYYGYVSLQQHTGYAILLFLGGVLIYGFAQLVALSDSIQERRFLWILLLFLLLPLWIGPLLYGFLGPKKYPVTDWMESLSLGTGTSQTRHSCGR
jgi:hypothetical protein